MATKEPTTTGTSAAPVKATKTGEGPPSTGAASAQGPAEDTLVGDLEVLHADDFARQKSTETNFLVTSSGERVKLLFASGREPHVGTGSKATVHGTHQGNEFVVTSAEVTPKAPPGASSSGPSAGVAAPPAPRKAIVLLVNFSNDRSTPITAADAKAQVFGTTGPAASGDGYYREDTFGFRSVVGIDDVDSGDASGWLRLDMSSSGNCDQVVDSWADAADAKAVTAGVNIGAYDHVLYVLSSTGSCNWGGLGELSGKRTWYPANNLVPFVVGHELGHNLGLHHANSYRCTDAASNRVAISDNCTSTEYGDPFDVMGGSYILRHNSSYFKGRLGALDPSNTQTVAVDGTYVLNPQEQPSTGAQAIRIPRRVDANGQQYYYLEYRQPFGVDNFGSGDPVANGISIRLGYDYGIPQFLQSQLIDTTPGTTSFADAALPVGSTFSDPGIVSIRTLSKTTTQVTVSIDVADCPDASLEPDNTVAQARPVNVGQTESHAFCAADDEDWVRFPATPGLTYRVETANLRPGTDTMLDVYGPDGTTSVGSNDDIDGNNRASLVTFSATSASYYVKARPYPNSASGPSATYDLTVTDSSGPLRVPTEADARVVAGKGGTNYGNDGTLTAKGGSSPTNSYLRFNVTGLSGAPASAKLRLRVTDGSNSGGSVHAVASSGWGETTITFNNAPAITPAVLSSIGPVANGQTVDFDLGNAIGGNGTYSFAITSASTDSVSWSSRQGSVVPELVITPGSPSEPTANFTATPTQATVNQPVAFTDISTGAPTTWAWTFGDGGTSASQSPTHAYATAGTYTVGLTVTNALGSDAETRTGYVTVTAGPLRVPTEADARVVARFGGTNYGNDGTLTAKGGSSPTNSYLRFNVTGLSGAPASAKLRLRVTDGSNSGGSVHAVASSGWGETTITFNNAPAITPAVLSSIGPVANGQTVDFDLGNAIGGNGTYSFAITSASTNSVSWSSRQGSVVPELVITPG